MVDHASIVKELNRIRHQHRIERLNNPSVVIIPPSRLLDGLFSRHGSFGFRLIKQSGDPKLHIVNVCAALARS